MIRILTIDWDYFFNAPLEVRDSNFPDNLNGCLDSVPDNNKWLEVTPPDMIYLDTLCISSLEDFIKMMPEFKSLFVSENHGVMFCVVDSIAKEKGGSPHFEITNVDFHHDYYFTNGNAPCCDNWMRLVKEKYPDTSLKWCRKEDSVLESFGCNVCKEVPIEEIEFSTVLCNLISGKYDFIHLCRSDLYSPPIADKVFDKLCSLFSLKASATITVEPIIDRDSVSREYIRKLKNNN